MINESDVTELQRQNAVLKTLFRKLFDEASWTVYDTIQNEAREAGAIIPHEVTQEDIDNVRFDSSECELGDTVFMMSDWMQNDDAKMPIPSKAEVAWEFFERVKCIESEYHRNRTGMIVSGGGRDAIESRIIRTMGQVLREWEDAESK